jgi:hypothetical protein
MGLFKRRKREPEFEVFTNEIPLTTMVRWFINDIGYGGEGVDSLMGLPPISEEGDTKEEQDSDVRLANLKPLVPFIDFLSDASANVLSTIALNGSDEDDLPFDEDMEDIAQMLGGLYKSIALSSIIGAFSIATSLGLINITALTSDVHQLKGPFDE